MSKGVPRAVPKIVLGNRSGTLALTQARGVLAELSEGWPDINVSQRTLRGRPHGAHELLEALTAGRIDVALQGLETLPTALPGGLTLAAVTKRLEPRAALVTRGAKTLGALPKGAKVGVQNARDRAFTFAARRELTVETYTGELDELLTLLGASELEALVVPSATLMQLGRRERIATLLEPQVFTPAPGQSTLALVVRKGDDLAADLAYSLQHRPSFDRVRAERAFAHQFSHHAPSAPHHIGAFASVSADGELNLLGAVASPDGELVIQAEVAGDAGEAEELGRELAQDVSAQLKQLVAR